LKKYNSKKDFRLKIQHLKNHYKKGLLQDLFCFSLLKTNDRIVSDKINQNA